MPIAVKFTDSKAWLVETFQVFEDRDRNLLAIYIWALWFARNKIIHDGIHQLANDIVGFILGYLKQIEALQTTTFPNHTNAHN